MRSVTVLGSTGSIGQSTIDLLVANRDAFKVVALTAQKNVALLAQQARELNAECAVVADPSLYGDLKSALSGTRVRAEAGDEAITAAGGSGADWTMAAIAGAAGLHATLAAVACGKTVALANKESLVCGGTFFMGEVERHRTTLLPVDSEHNAVFQVFDPRNRAALRRIILTASGGPFLRRKREDLDHVTPEEAIRHPKWSMGQKISVDSATMMNKSLEIIEASYFFKVEHKKIEVLIHPQSTVHSMIEYNDGSILSQMGMPDMRTPIAYTLGWPVRIQTTGGFLNLNNNLNLSFEQIDINRFYALKLAREALDAGQYACIAFNAANEVAVEAFLARQLKFSHIESIVEAVLQETKASPATNFEDIMHIDVETRRLARDIVSRKNA